jgi:hypothetical protein
MNQNSTKSERIGDVVGQRLAERLIEMMRPGAIIVDNRSTPVQPDPEHRYQPETGEEAR